MPSPAVVSLSSHHDERGMMVVADRWDALPFIPVRMFVVTRVPAHVVRGDHASRTGHELLVAAAGVCTVEAEWGSLKQTFVLDRPDRALHVPPLVWTRYQHDSEAAVLVVLASTPYDPADSINDHQHYREIVASMP